VPVGAPLIREAALAFLAGTAAFWLASAALSGSDSDLVALVLGAAFLAVIILVARTLGVPYAVPVAMAGILAFDWFYVPPTHTFEVPDTANLVQLLAYLGVGVLIGQLAADAVRRAKRSERARAAIAAEQAALRRVATLVARGSPAEDVFDAVAEELGQLLNIEDTALLRYEADGMATVVVNRIQGGVRTPVGARVRLEGTMTPLGFHSGIGSPIVVEGRPWGALVAVSRRADSLPVDAEARMNEFTELIGTAISNIQARADLAESRARIAEAADDERRRVVRDLHDGAQQRLVHTIVTLKLAELAAEDGGEIPPSLVTEAIAEAELATAELRELAHGILPSALTRCGLRAGLEALTVRMRIPVDISVSAERLPAAVEATAYFVVAEALTNVAKHSRASHAEVEVQVDGGHLRIRVRDDGVGGVRPDGSGLVGLADRVAVLHGRFHAESAHDGGTVVDASIPLMGQVAELRR
jgi:signal transduction histidine kinase